MTSHGELCKLRHKNDMRASGNLLEAFATPSDVRDRALSQVVYMLSIFMRENWLTAGFGINTYATVRFLASDVLYRLFCQLVNLKMQPLFDTQSINHPI